MGAWGTMRGRAAGLWRRRALRVVMLLAVLVAAWFGGSAVVRGLYAGPNTVPQVVGAMPGVPVFPRATMASSNGRTQRLMAVPVSLLRRQGIHAETAVLSAPAEQADVVEWYRRMAPGLGWALVGEDAAGSRARLVFLRRSEGLQVTVGATVDHLATPVQYVYLTGLPTAAIPELIAAAPAPPPTSTSTGETRRHAPVAEPTPKPATPPTKPPTPATQPTKPAERHTAPAPEPRPRATRAPERSTRSTSRRDAHRTETRRRSPRAPEARQPARPERPHTEPRRTPPRNTEPRRTEPRRTDPPRTTPTPPKPRVTKPVVTRPKTDRRPDKPLVPNPPGGGTAPDGT